MYRIASSVENEILWYTLKSYIIIIHVLAIKFNEGSMNKFDLYQTYIFGQYDSTDLIDYTFDHRIITKLIIILNNDKLSYCQYLRKSI